MGIWIFAELAWNAYLRPKISGFWESGPIKIIDHRPDPQKAHLHLKPRIISVNAFNSVHIILWPVGEAKEIVYVFVSKKLKLPLFAHPKWVIRFL